jgi:hypothetical protein
LGCPRSTSGAAPLTAQFVAQFETAKRFRSGTYTVFILPTHPPVEAHVKKIAILTFLGRLARSGYAGSKEHSELRRLVKFQPMTIQNEKVTAF